jgi:formylglycine-generating enzyme required for sulfatase activity
VTVIRVFAATLSCAIVAAGCLHRPDGATRGGSTRMDHAGIRQAWVPPGDFTMGSDDAAVAAIRAATPPRWIERELDDEKPAHRVSLTRGYWIDVHEVTNAAYQAFVAQGGYTKQAHWSEAGWAWLAKQDAASLPAACEGTGPELPRRCVTWYEAEAYAHWRGGRLPTEAEWEFAARGPESRIYPWGETFDPSRCNVVDSKGAVPVGSYPGGVSWVGLHDMAGNAMEWVADWRGPHDAAPANDPRGPSAGTIKVEKGGWWGSDAIVARAAYRHYEDPPEYGDKHIGFRVVSDGTD